MTKEQFEFHRPNLRKGDSVLIWYEAASAYAPIRITVDRITEKDDDVIIVNDGNQGFAVSRINQISR